MPKIHSGDNRTKICGVASVECYEDALWTLFSIDIIDGMKDKVARAYRENCNCLPACTTISYEATVNKNKQEGNIPG